jgi:predicted lipoprotein with Yx(FWY)xxD motif
MPPAETAHGRPGRATGENHDSDGTQVLFRLAGGNPTRRMLGALALMSILGAALAGCGSAAPSEKGGASPAATAGGPLVASSSVDAVRVLPPPTGATVKVMRTQYGRVLVDGRGRALYLFTRDRTPSSQCSGPCVTAWPPLLTRGKPVAGAGARANLLGTIRRRDGSTQVTYHGHPLYHYVGDRLPGQVLCQDVEEFGGRWYVVTPSGSAVL